MWRVLVVLMLLVGEASSRPKSKAPERVAIVLVVDASKSMTGAKLEAAKEAALVTLASLDPEDQLAVVSFDTRSDVVVPLAKVGTDHAAAQRAIAGIGAASADADLYPALARAVHLLDGVTAPARAHVVVVTDVKSAGSAPDELFAHVAKHRITMSAVGLQNPDRQILAGIADAGSGRLYMVESFDAVPKILLKETLELRRVDPRDAVR